MDVRKMIGNQTEFALRVLNHVLLKRSRDSNVVFSPSSIHIALSLIAAGSNDPTLEQILSFLKAEKRENLNSLASQLVSTIFIDGSGTGGPLLSFLNGVWIQNLWLLKPSFAETAIASYRAEAKEVDFIQKAAEVVSEVNTWAEKETRGLITQLLQSDAVDATTRVILANALYFKGAWKNRFEEAQTRDSEFYLLDGTSIRVPFMRSGKKQFISCFEGFRVLTLPYRKGEDRRQFSMYFFLPEKKDGLHNLIEKMGSDPGFVDRHIPLQEVPVGDFRVPRFKIGYGFEVSNELRELGLVLPFTSEGDLTEMVEGPEGDRLFVSGVFHKAFVEINEEGSEAAAASAAVIKLRALAVETAIDFVADHPFVFLIREDMTGVVLFAGHIINPLLGV